MKRFLAVLSGALLIVAVALIEPWLAVAAAVCTVLGWWFRPAAVLAVLLAAAGIAHADADLLVSAATGLVATTYLLESATLTAPAGVVPTTIPTVLGAVTFGAAAVLTALIPLDLPYAPLATPLLVLLLAALVLAGLAVRRGPGGEGGSTPSEQTGSEPAAD